MRATISGSSNVKMLPSPTRLVAASAPSSNRVSCWEMQSPSPVPPKSRVIELSACMNGSNSRAMTGSAMPMPVSRTAKRSLGAGSS